MTAIEETSSNNQSYDDIVKMVTISPIKETGIACSSNSVAQVTQEINNDGTEYYEKERETNIDKELEIEEQYKEFEIEEEYLELYDSVEKGMSLKPKTPSSRKKIQKELEIVNNEKLIPRDPSYYKLDKESTSILKSFLEKKYLGSYHNVLCRDNSSVVIHAQCCYGSRILKGVFYGNGLAIKVYKMGYNVEKNKLQLDRAQREYDTLLIVKEKKSYKYNPVPLAVHKERNVIVMTFVGTPPPFPSSLTYECYQGMYLKTVNDIYKWYNQLGLVHGNLCSKNLLYWHHEPYYIGWSHSVRREHPKALKKLMRDCRFVTEFFKSRGIYMKPTDKLFKEITGVHKISQNVLEVINTGSWKDYNRTNPNRNIKELNCSTNLRFK